MSSVEHNLVNIEPRNKTKEPCLIQGMFFIVLDNMAKLNKIWVFSFFQKGGGFLDRKLISIVSSVSPMVWEGV